MEERATRRPLRSARARGSKGPKTKRAAAALLHKWCTWIRTETPGCLPAGWEAGSRCGQKNPHPLFRPTDAPKSNNSTHQSAWDWSVVALTRVVETRSAILATSTNGPKPCSPCRKISPSRTPLPTPPPLPGAPLALAFFELCDPAAHRSPSPPVHADDTRCTKPDSYQPRSQTDDDRHCHPSLGTHARGIRVPGRRHHNIKKSPNILADIAVLLFLLI